MGLALVVALVPVGSEPAEACAPRTLDSTDTRCSYVYPMTFPVVGGGLPGWSLFGEPRAGGDRRHAGVDIGAPKLTPVVAVRAGTVAIVRNTPEDCCWLAVRHDDGWMSMYVHLNDDTIGTDDGQGVGIRPGLAEGDRVDRGELLGWTGDSGNAEGGPPHLHFELRAPWGEPVDPAPSLSSALRRTHPALSDRAIGGASAGAYVDYDLDTSARVFDTATALGLAASCDDHAVRACPRDDATRGDVAGWLAALAGHPVIPPIIMPAARFDLDDASCVAIACPEPMTRGELARIVMLARHPEATVESPEDAISFLHARGEVDGCDSAELDPSTPLTRSEALQMLLRAWGHLFAPPCDRIS